MKQQVDYQMVVSRAKGLLQRAGRLPDADDLMRRIHENIELVERLECAESWNLNVRGATEVLDSIETDLEAREAAAAASHLDRERDG